MVDRGAAERACKDANPIIDGRKANVNLAYLGAKPRSSQTSEFVGSLLNTQDLISRMCLVMLWPKIPTNHKVKG